MNRSVEGDKQAPMIETVSKGPRFQFSMGGLVLIMSAAALILWLSEVWEGHGGLASAIALCAVPFSILVEYALGLRPSSESLGWKRWLSRAAILCLCSVVPAIAAQVGMGTSIQWWSPMPILSQMWSRRLDELLINPRYFFWVPAVVVFLILAGRVAVHRGLTHLPLRSVVLLLIFTCTSILWFSIAIFGGEGYHSKFYLRMSILSNSIVIIGLWASWLALRNRFSDPLVILWNMVLVSWLFWLAHPWIGGFSMRILPALSP